MPRLLLVEDNEMNRDMLTRRLRARGYEVALAIDGAACLQAVAADPPDLVVMDLRLPVLDGWETTRRLKADPSTRAIPVLALTAHAMVRDRESAIAAGCDEYATKPVDMPALIEKIDRLLAIRDGRGTR